MTIPDTASTLGTSADAANGHTITKLAYSGAEVRSILGISSATEWRLNQRGLLRPIAGLRLKRYGAAELRRFIAGTAEAA